ncbi:hypothetical protein SDC9_99766 [bioreactor metagenome]|uniref:Type II/III secretion system secretin-like domain-containing protein n=1 Tax=bioreactor metagenome TaxID=1076179 RepID=A0A645AIF3_9ZZZZ
MTTGELAIQTGSTGTMTQADGMLYAAQVPVKDEGPVINVTPVNSKFKFNLSITPSVTEKASVLDVTVGTISLLGYTSAGAPRTTSYSSTQRIMLGNGRNRFFLGGIEKAQTVRDSAGVPLLKDLPGLGWLFSTERESLKRTQLVVVAECELIQHGTLLAANDLKQIELIRNNAVRKNDEPSYGYRQYLLDPER